VYKEREKRHMTLESKGHAGLQPLSAANHEKRGKLGTKEEPIEGETQGGAHWKQLWHDEVAEKKRRGSANHEVMTRGYALGRAFQVRT